MLKRFKDGTSEVSITESELNMALEILSKEDQYLYDCLSAYLLNIKLLKQRNMILERKWAMPNKNTFSIIPIKQLLKEEMDGGTWIDPFANGSTLATITNDLNPDFDTDYHMDALEFLKQFEDNSIDGVLYDPPYSPRQVSECYKSIGKEVTQQDTQASFWSKHKNEIARILKPNGKVICFGWNSMGCGLKRGFEMKRLLVVPHGGNHNDTIVTVEVKVK